MRKIKISIIILIIVILILLGIILILKLQSNNSNIYNKSNASNNLIDKTEIEKSIIFGPFDFEPSNYESIGDVVFYRKGLNLDNEEKEDLNIIAEQFKVKYPNRCIIYSRLKGKNIGYDKKIYCFYRIIDGQKFNKIEETVRIREDGRIFFGFPEEKFWENEIYAKNIKINQKQAEQIVINYLYEHPGDYGELRRGGFGIEECNVMLYMDSSRVYWEMQFLTGNSYIKVDANTGEILDKYFFCGIIVN